MVGFMGNRRQMAVLPDADKGDVDGGGAQRRRGVGEDLVEIGVAVEEMKASSLSCR